MLTTLSRSSVLFSSPPPFDLLSIDGFEFGSPETRDDVYYVVPNPSIGIKLVSGKQSQVETKQTYASPFAKAVSGQ